MLRRCAAEASTGTDGRFVYTQYGSTPLHLACDSGHTEAIKELLQSGADVEAKDEVSAESIGAVAVVGMCGERRALYLVKEGSVRGENVMMIQGL